MTQEQWIALFRPTLTPYVWQKAHAAVVTEAKEVLATLAEGATLTSNELVEKLLPSAEARGLGIDVRAQIFAALRRAVARHAFDGWIDTSTKARHYGRDVAVYKWHKKKLDSKKGHVVTCPVCDHQFDLED